MNGIKTVWQSTWRHCSLSTRLCHTPVQSIQRQMHSLCLIQRQICYPKEVMLTQRSSAQSTKQKRNLRKASGKSTIISRATSVIIKFLEAFSQISSLTAKENPQSNFASTLDGKMLKKYMAKVNILCKLNNSPNAQMAQTTPNTSGQTMIPSLDSHFLSTSSRETGLSTVLATMTSARSRANKEEGYTMKTKTAAIP